MDWDKAQYVGQIGGGFTASQDGYYYFYTGGSGSSGEILHSFSLQSSYSFYPYYSYVARFYTPCLIPCKKGTKFKNPDDIIYIWYIPFKK